LLTEALSIASAALGDDHPRVARIALDLAQVRILGGDGAAVESLVRRALEVRERLYAPGDWRIAQAQALLGASLLAQNRRDEAERLMLEADKGLKPIAGRQARDRDANRARLASLRQRR
jgi:hypothetical protein